METKGIITVAVTVTVAVIVLAGILMPVLDDATTKDDTFSNVNGSMFRVEKITEDSPYVAVWDVEKPNIITVNGQEVDLNPGTILCTSASYLLRYVNNGTNASIQSIGASLGITIATSSSTTGTITIDNTTNEGYMTFTTIKDGGSPVVKTDAIGDTYGISTKGDYVMKSSTQTAYLNSDSPILAMGLTTFNGNYATGFYISGNPEDGFSVSNFNPVPATANTSNITSDLTAASDHEDLYTLKEIKFTISAVSDPSITANATYNYFIVPSEVTAERTVHLADNQNVLLSVIPIFILVAVLLGVVAVVLRNRMG